MNWNFHYGTTDIRGIQVTKTQDTHRGSQVARELEVEGIAATPTPRFWKSLFMRFGMSESVFRYFDYDEVFARVSQRSKDDKFRYCIASNNEGQSRLLAVSSLKRPVIRHEEVTDLLNQHDGQETTYADGIVTSRHVPRGGERPFDIGGDAFEHRFQMETPVDGFGHPKIYLSLLRQVCSNGAIGYAKAFRSDVSLGKDVAHCISRALASYDNEEGYAALRQRFESAQTSWASVRECRMVTQILEKNGLISGGDKNNLRRDFHRMSGNLNELYGLANLDALSNKRQRILPSRCKVYDLINFASEVATHHSRPTGSRALQACIGSLISDEYDMEGTAHTGGEFADLLVTTPDSGPSVSVN